MQLTRHDLSASLICVSSIEPGRVSELSRLSLLAFDSIVYVLSVSTAVDNDEFPIQQAIRESADRGAAPLLSVQNRESAIHECCIHLSRVTVGNTVCNDVKIEKYKFKMTRKSFGVRVAATLTVFLMLPILSFGNPKIASIVGENTSGNFIGTERTKIITPIHKALMTQRGYIQVKFFNDINLLIKGNVEN